MLQLVNVSTGGRLNINKPVNFDPNPEFLSSIPLVSCVDVGTRGTGGLEEGFDLGSPGGPGGEGLDVGRPGGPGGGGLNEGKGGGAAFDGGMGGGGGLLEGLCILFCFIS